MIRLKKLSQHLTNTSPLVMVRRLPLTRSFCGLCSILTPFRRYSLDLQNEVSGSMAVEGVIEETIGNGNVRFFHHPHARLGEILLNRPQKMNAVTKGTPLFSGFAVVHCSRRSRIVLEEPSSS